MTSNYIYLTLTCDQTPSGLPLLERVEVSDGQLVSVEMKQPFHGLFFLAGSNKGRTVGEAGFEPATPWPPAKCAAGLRYSPIGYSFYAGR